MTLRAQAPRTRQDFHDAAGVLLVVRDPPPAAPQPGQPPLVAGDPAEGAEILVDLLFDIDSRAVFFGIAARRDEGRRIAAAVVERLIVISHMRPIVVYERAQNASTAEQTVVVVGL